MTKSLVVLLLVLVSLLFFVLTRDRHMSPSDDILLMEPVIGIESLNLRRTKVLKASGAVECFWNDGNYCGPVSFRWVHWLTNGEHTIQFECYETGSGCQPDQVSYYLSIFSEIDKNIHSSYPKNGGIMPYKLVYKYTEQENLEDYAESYDCITKEGNPCDDRTALQLLKLFVKERRPFF